MANLTNEKAEFAIAIIRHFSPLFAIFRHWPPPPPPPPPPPLRLYSSFYTAIYFQGSEGRRPPQRSEDVVHR